MEKEHPHPGRNISAERLLRDREIIKGLTCGCDYLLIVSRVRTTLSSHRNMVTPTCVCGIEETDQRAF